MNAPQAPVNFAVQAGFGFTLVVVFISLILLGGVFTQAYSYYVQYPNDKTWMKVYVGVIVLLDVMSSVSACTWEFLLLVQNWGVEAAFLDAFSLLALNPLFCGLTGCMVHLFFAWRVYVLTSSRVLSGIIAFFGTTAFITAVAVSLMFTILKSPTAMMQLKPLAATWLLSSVAGDAAITLSLTYQFQQVKLQTRQLGREESRQLNHVLNRILRSTVQNGLLTSLVALIDLLLFLINGGSPTHTVAFLIPKLYAITVLSSLNARPVVHDWRKDDTVVEKGTQFSLAQPELIAANLPYQGKALPLAADIESYPVKKPISRENTSSSPAGPAYRPPVFSPETSFIHDGTISSKTVVPRPHAFPLAPVAPRWSRETNTSTVRADTSDAPPLKARPSAELLRARQMRTPPPPTTAPVGPMPAPPVPAKSTAAVAERPLAPQFSAGEPVDMDAQLQQRRRSQSWPCPQPIVNGAPSPRAF